jgi:hypothetical protein
VKKDDPLPPESNRAIVKIEVKILVSRADLEQEHRLLIARLHLLRRQLGYPPLTQKEQTRQAAK